MWDEPGDLAIEERKVATILFADLVGSTELSGRLDPEALRAVVMRYFALLADRIERRGGTVEKFIGDAVMAVFGVPATHEDDVRRALAAALEILTALEEFNTELAARYDVRLQVRIGVNTGEVIATRDAGRRQNLVSGEVVNLAARLEQHAGAGEVLIGAETYRAAVGAAVTGEQRRLLVKGKSEPIDAYPLLDLLPDDPATTRRFDLPFVGRTREFAALSMAAERVELAGASSVVMVYGDPGIGKTRLLAEWLSRTPPELVWAMARCRTYADDGSLRPLYELISQLTTAGPESLGPLRDRLATAVAADLPLTDVYPPLVDLIDALAGERTVCLVVDDVQWASTLLLETVDRLCEDLGGRPLLCLCAARPDLSEARPRVGQGVLNFSSIELTALADGEVELLAAALSDVIAHDTTVLRALVDRAEGNPLHLEQLAAASHDGHQIGQIPPTLRALIAARLDVLLPAERRVLDAAAVVGREFAATDLVPLLAGPDPVAEINAVLRAMTRRRLLESHRRPGGEPATHRFASNLIHDVVYEAMTKARRAALHEQVAAAVEADGGAGDRAARSARAGGHLERAYRCRTDLGQSEASLADLRRRAIDHLVAAGAAALHRVDLPWARDLAGRAVGLARPDDPARPRALELHGEVLLATGDRDGARDALAAARDGAAAAGAPVVAAHARLVLAQLDPSGGSVADVARAVAGVFAEAGDDLGLARTRIRIGGELQSRGRHADALGELEAALAHAVAAGTDIERANALGAIGQSLWLGPQPVPDAVDRCRELLATYGADRRAVQATLGFPLTVLYAAGGRPECAAEQLAAAHRAMTELGYAEAAVFRPLLGGMVAALAGATGQAAPDLRAELDAARRLGAGMLVRLAAREYARTLLAAGDVDAVAPLVELAAHPSVADPTELADIAGVRAWYAAARGQAAEAVRLAGEAVAAAARTDSPVTTATAYLDRTRALAASGDTAGAREAARAARAAYQSKGHTVGTALAATLAAG